MPILSLQFRAQMDPGIVLERQGPRVPVELYVPTQLQAMLLREKKPVPGPVTGHGLIDTGASSSMVDEEVITKLCVEPVGTIEIWTPSGKSQAAKYPVRVAITLPPNPPLVVAELASIPAGPLRQQGYLCLIGRDILRHALLVYQGSTGQVSVAF